MPDFSFLGFKRIRDLKPGSVFLVEDLNSNQFVLKQGSMAKRLVGFSRLVRQQGGDLANLVPEFKNEGDWFWQKFLTWDVAGDTVETYGIRNEAFGVVNPEKLGRAIWQLQSLCFSDPSLDKRLADFYIKNVVEAKEAINQEFGQGFFDKVQEFLTSKKALVDKYTCFLANGDLHPQNIMIKETNFVLVDWDLLHLNNPGWDLTDLFVWGWRDSNWRERLLSAYKKVIAAPISDFEQVFAFDVVYLTSQLVKHAKLVNAPVEFLEAQKKFLQESLLK